MQDLLHSKGSGISDYDLSCVGVQEGMYRLFVSGELGIVRSK